MLIKVQSRKEEKQKIIQLYLQCKDSVEIANVLGVTDGRIRQIVNKFKNEEINALNLVPESLQYYNVWNFPKKRKKGCVF